MAKKEKDKKTRKNDIKGYLLDSSRCIFVFVNVDVDKNEHMFYYPIRTFVLIKGD